MEKRGPSNSPELEVEETTNEARQGVTQHNVRYVLAYGVAGVAIALLVVYILYFFPTLVQAISRASGLAGSQ